MQRNKRRDKLKNSQSHQWLLSVLSSERRQGRAERNKRLWEEKGYVYIKMEDYKINE